MITEGDSTKLKETFALQSDMLEVKRDIKELKQDMSSVKETTQQILTIVDGIAKKLDNNTYDHVAFGLKADRHEKWINQLANKSDTKLEE